MTTHDDLTELETRLRASLRDRADDVDTTPALYERVQRRASRGAWLRRGLALAGAAAVVAVAFAVVPPLLPEPDIDIAETPEDAQPTDGSTADEDAAPGDPAGFAAAMAEAGVAWSDGATVHVGDWEFAATDYFRGGPGPSVAGGRVTALAVESRPLSGPNPVVAAVLRGQSGGAIGWTHIDGDVIGFGGVAASPNGDGITFVPGDMATLAWIEGTDLHLHSLGGVFDRRVLPLEGDVPDDLVAEQWVAQGDGQFLLASDPDGGLWSLPMDDSNAANTAPTDPGFRIPDSENAIDGLLRPDRTRVDLEVFPDGDAPARLSAGEGSVTPPLPGALASSTALRLVGNGSWLVAVNDPVSGVGTLLHLDETGRYRLGHSWAGPVPVTAAAPLRMEEEPGSPADIADDDSAEDAAATGAAALGLPTDAVVAGTAGTDLVVRTTDGRVARIAVYPAESEATLGRLAVRPGSTLADGLVAVESFSEGENSIRFVALRAGTATPVGEVLVTGDPVTGLVWTEDGGTVIWSDPAGIHAASIAGDGDVAGLAGESISEDTRPVLDAVWTSIERDGGFVTAASGYLTVGVNGVTGVELLGLEREGDSILRMTGPAGGSDRLEFETHATPGDAGAPRVSAAVGGGTAILRWHVGDDRFGELPDPGQLGGDVRVQVSGGHVLAMGDSRQVLVTFDGDVVELPTAADWDVLD